MDLIGPLQLRIMHYMWNQEACTVHDVHSALNDEHNAPQLAYTTVLTVMRNLVRRDILSQTPAGRSHIFATLIDEHSYKTSLLAQICDNFFGGDSTRMANMLPAVQADLATV